MIPARTALAIAFLACWDAWRLLAGRIDDVTSAVLVASLIGVLVRRAAAIDGARVPATAFAIALSGYAIACVTGPALLQIAAAVGVMVFVAGRDSVFPRLPAAGLAALLLPVLPTLDFLLAYPLRRISAAITVVMLRFNGIEVSLNGIALEWQGQSLLFDGPCSGVRMLWAALVLASLVALVGRLGTVAYVRLLATATAIAVIGNSLRAASLFYLENGFVQHLQGPAAHEAIGMLSFALVAIAVLTAPRMRWRTT